MRDPRLGDTYRWASEIDKYRHLWIVISEPAGQGQEVLFVAVNLTSMDGEAVVDPSCVLMRGCHPFVHHKSFVNYRYATMVTVARFRECLGARLVGFHEAMSGPTLAAVIAGASKSPHIRPRVKRFLGIGTVLKTNAASKPTG